MIRSGVAATAAGDALREVADAVWAYQRSAEQLVSQQQRVAAQRQLPAAETDVVNARLTQQLALVQVYRALGGGWAADRPTPRKARVAP